MGAQTRQGRVGLLPGQKSEGFSYGSPGLPTVVKCYVRPHTRLKGVGEEIPEALHAAIQRVAWKQPQGVTVGPEKPIKQFSPEPFLRNVTDYVSVSLEQGWIESDEVAREFKLSISRLQAAVEKGDKRARYLY